MPEVKLEEAKESPVPQDKPGFLSELQELWKSLPYRWLFTGLFASWLLLFHFLGNSTLGYIDTRSLFGWLRYVYNSSPDDEHGFIMPLAVIGVLWWKKDELIAVKKEIWWPALALFVVALVMHLAGYLVQQTRISVVGFFLGIYGLMGMIWGWHWLKATFFPMILLVFCVPLGTLAEAITFPLRMFVTAASVGFSSHVLAIDVMRVGSQIVDSHGRALYDVAPACSGIRSLTTMTALTMMYGFLSFDQGWKRGVILLSAIPLAVLGNLARVTTVIIIGEAFGKDVASAVEQKLGFITFGVAFGCIFVLGWLLQRGEQAKATSAPAAPMEGVA